MVWMKVPYTNFHNLNQDWIVHKMMEFEEYMEHIVQISVIKYADPIQWRITGQYEQATVVIDAETGIAYISVQPVPAGISITNTDYWTPVFDLTEVLGDIDGKIAEEAAARSSEDTRLEGLIGDEETARTEADTVINQNITNLGDRIDDVIANQFWASVKDYGAVGDGITDDTDAIQAAMDQTDFNYIQFPTGTYMVTRGILVQRSGMYISGYGAKITKNDYTNNHVMMRVMPNDRNINNIVIEGLEFDGKKPAGAGTFDPTGGSAPAIDVISGSNSIYNVNNVTLRDLYIHDNMGRGIGVDGGSTPFAPRTKNITIEGCYITNTKGAIVQSCVTSTVRNNTLELSFLENITIDNGCLDCIVDGNRLGTHYGGAGNISMDEGRRVKITNNFINNYRNTTATYNNGITMNANTGTFALVYIAGNRIQGNMNNGIWAHMNQFTPVDSAIIVNNYFDGNEEAEIKIEACSGAIKIDNNTYLSGSAVTKIDIPETYYSNVRYCDYPLYYTITDLLTNSWTVQDANVTSVYQMGSRIVGSLRLTAGTAAQAMLIPTGSRPFSNVHPLVFDDTGDIAGTGLVRPSGTVTVTANYTAGHIYNIDFTYDRV